MSPGENRWDWRGLLRFRLTTVFWLFVLAGALVRLWTWQREFDQRLLRIERQLFSVPDPLWSTAMAVGTPDEPGMGGRAWCPSQMDAGLQWLTLDYESAVTPVSIEVHETYATGALRKVVLWDAANRERVAWSGTDPTPAGSTIGTSTVPVSIRQKTNRITLHVDTDVAGWNCIDAVALVSATGKRYWATKAQASSSYGTVAPIAPTLRQPF